MARAATKAAPAVEKKPSTALVPWEEQMAREAEAAAKMEENSGGGQFFSTKAGILSWQGTPLPNNRMGVVILDSIFENVFYEGEYDPNDVQPPTCFAFGRDEATMEPHPSVVAAGQAQHATCKGCPHNEWGSADKGRGKACRNGRRLGTIPAGSFDKEGRFTAYQEDEHFAGAVVGYLKPPVTSIKGYASFVKTLAATAKRPPHGVFTQIRCEAHEKNQYTEIFEAISKVPDDLMAVVMARREEVQALIEFPYSLERSDPPEKPVVRRPANSKLTKGRR